jgi:hypothetical protein
MDSGYKRGIANAGLSNLALRQGRVGVKDRRVPALLLLRHIFSSGGVMLPAGFVIIPFSTI